MSNDDNGWGTILEGIADVLEDLPASGWVFAFFLLFVIVTAVIYWVG